MNHLDPTQNHTGRGNGLEPEQRPHSPLDGAMVLFKAVIELGILADANGLQTMS
jgi:hypothetical protein